MIYYDTNNGKHDKNNVANGKPGTARIKTFVLRKLYFEIRSRNACLLWNQKAYYYAQETPPSVPMRRVAKFCLHPYMVFL